MLKFEERESQASSVSMLLSSRASRAFSISAPKLLACSNASFETLSIFTWKVRPICYPKAEKSPKSARVLPSFSGYLAFTVSRFTWLLFQISLISKGLTASYSLLLRSRISHPGGKWCLLEFLSSIMNENSEATSPMDR